MSSVSVKNCIKFYTTADDIGAGTLKDYCSRLISTHWVGEAGVTPKLGESRKSRLCGNRAK